MVKLEPTGNSEGRSLMCEQKKKVLDQKRSAAALTHPFSYPWVCGVPSPARSLWGRESRHGSGKSSIPGAFVPFIILRGGTLGAPR